MIFSSGNLALCTWMHIHGGMHVRGYHARSNTRRRPFTPGSTWLTWWLLLLLLGAGLRSPRGSPGLTLLVRLLPLLRGHLGSPHWGWGLGGLGRHWTCRVGGLFGPGHHHLLKLLQTTASTPARTGRRWRTRGAVKKGNKNYSKKRCSWKTMTKVGVVNKIEANLELRNPHLSFLNLTIIGFSRKII